MSKKIAVLFGGVSSEHEVSRVSAACVLENLPEEYESICIGITRDGRWLYCPADTDAMRSGAWENHPGCVPAFISPDAAVHGIIRQTSDGWVTEYIDVVFPVLHGKNGEDGTVQGLLEMAGIPYVGCGVLASAACMDKVMTNTLFNASGVPHCKWDWMSTAQLPEFDAIEERVAARLGYPIFVKPANAGSSKGVSKANNKTELRAAVELAARNDSKIVFEETVIGHEVECAVLGNASDGEATLLASTPGEILAANEFYDYEAKYHNPASETVIPAHITPEQQETVRTLAKKAYAALGCSGLSRCDFFVRHTDGAILINEINTLPGFTPISMYPKLIGHMGIGYTALLQQLVELAEKLAAEKQTLTAQMFAE